MSTEFVQYPEAVETDNPISSDYGYRSSHDDRIRRLSDQVFDEVKSMLTKAVDQNIAVQHVEVTVKYTPSRRTFRL